MLTLVQLTHCNVARKVAVELDAELSIFTNGGRIGWQEFSDFVSMCLCTHLKNLNRLAAQIFLNVQNAFFTYKVY